MGIDIGKGIGTILAMLLSTAAFLLVLVLFITVGSAVIKGIYEYLKPDEERRKRFVEIIDDSVKGYRDRIRFERNRVFHWECRSKRYSFQIALQRDARNYVLRITFNFELQSVDAVSAKSVDVARGLAITEQSGLTGQEMESMLLPLKAFTRVYVRSSGVSTTKIIDPDDDLQNWREELTGIIAFVRYLLDAEKWSQPGSTSQTHCPYCRSEIGEQDAVSRCRKCRTAHHEECWKEQGRCSVFGCGSSSHN